MTTTKKNNDDVRMKSQLLNTGESSNNSFLNYVTGYVGERDEMNRFQESTVKINTLRKDSKKKYDLISNALTNITDFTVSDTPPIVYSDRRIDSYMKTKQRKISLLYRATVPLIDDAGLTQLQMDLDKSRIQIQALERGTKRLKQKQREKTAMETYAEDIDRLKSLGEDAKTGFVARLPQILFTAPAQIIFTMVKQKAGMVCLKFTVDSIIAGGAMSGVPLLATAFAAPWAPIIVGGIVLVFVGTGLAAAERAGDDYYLDEERSLSALLVPGVKYMTINAFKLLQPGQVNMVQSTIKEFGIMESLPTICGSGTIINSLIPMATEMTWVYLGPPSKEVITTVFNETMEYGTMTDRRLTSLVKERQVDVAGSEGKTVRDKMINGLAARDKMNFDSTNLMRALNTNNEIEEARYYLGVPLPSVVAWMRRRLIKSDKFLAETARNNPGLLVLSLFEIPYGLVMNAKMERIPGSTIITKPIHMLYRIWINVAKFLISSIQRVDKIRRIVTNGVWIASAGPAVVVSYIVRHAFIGTIVHSLFAILAPLKPIAKILGQSAAILICLMYTPLVLDTLIFNGANAKVFTPDIINWVINTIGRIVISREFWVQFTTQNVVTPANGMVTDFIRKNLSGFLTTATILAGIPMMVSVGDVNSLTVLGAIAGAVAGAAVLNYKGYKHLEGKSVVDLPVEFIAGNMDRLASFIMDRMNLNLWISDYETRHGRVNALHVGTANVFNFVVMDLFVVSKINTITSQVNEYVLDSFSDPSNMFNQRGNFFQTNMANYFGTSKGWEEEIIDLNTAKAIVEQTKDAISQTNDPEEKKQLTSYLEYIQTSMVLSAKENRGEEVLLTRVPTIESINTFTTSLFLEVYSSWRSSENTLDANNEVVKGLFTDINDLSVKIQTDRTNGIELVEENGVLKVDFQSDAELAHGDLMKVATKQVVNPNPDNDNIFERPELNATELGKVKFDDTDGTSEVLTFVGKMNTVNQTYNREIQTLTIHERAIQRNIMENVNISRNERKKLINQMEIDYQPLRAIKHANETVDRMKNDIYILDLEKQKSAGGLTESALKKINDDLDLAKNYGKSPAQIIQERAIRLKTNLGDVVYNQFLAIQKSISDVFDGSGATFGSRFYVGAAASVALTLTTPGLTFISLPVAFLLRAPATGLLFSKGIPVASSILTSLPIWWILPDRSLTPENRFYKVKAREFAGRFMPWDALQYLDQGVVNMAENMMENVIEQRRKNLQVNALHKRRLQDQLKDFEKQVDEYMTNNAEFLISYDIQRTMEDIQTTLDFLTLQEESLRDVVSIIRETREITYTNLEINSFIYFVENERVDDMFADPDIEVNVNAVMNEIANDIRTDMAMMTATQVDIATTLETSYGYSYGGDDDGSGKGKHYVGGGNNENPPIKAPSNNPGEWGETRVLTSSKLGVKLDGDANDLRKLEEFLPTEVIDIWEKYRNEMSQGGDDDKFLAENMVFLYMIPEARAQLEQIEVNIPFLLQHVRKSGYMRPFESNYSENIQFETSSDPSSQIEFNYDPFLKGDDRPPEDVGIDDRKRVIGNNGIHFDFRARKDALYKNRDLPIAARTEEIYVDDATLLQLFNGEMADETKFQSVSELYTVLGGRNFEFERDVLGKTQPERIERQASTFKMTWGNPMLLDLFSSERAGIDISDLNRNKRNQFREQNIQFKKELRGFKKEFDTNSRILTYTASNDISYDKGSTLGNDFDELIQGLANVGGVENNSIFDEVDVLLSKKNSDFTLTDESMAYQDPDTILDTLAVASLPGSNSNRSDPVQASMKEKSWNVWTRGFYTTYNKQLPRKEGYSIVDGVATPVAIGVNSDTGIGEEKDRPIIDDQRGRYDADYGIRNTSPYGVFRGPEYDNISINPPDTAKIDILMDKSKNVEDSLRETGGTRNIEIANELRDMRRNYDNVMRSHANMVKVNIVTSVQSAVNYDESHIGGGDVGELMRNYVLGAFQFGSAMDRVFSQPAFVNQLEEWGVDDETIQNYPEYAQIKYNKIKNL